MAKQTGRPAGRTRTAFGVSLPIDLIAAVKTAATDAGKSISRWTEIVLRREISKGSKQREK